MNHPCVILSHLTRTGSHFDWLIDLWPGGRLWTGRVTLPPRAWSGAFGVEVLPAHRRVYLDYQGPIADDRGRVVRVDEGQVRPLLVAASRMMLDVRLRDFRGRVELRRLCDQRWRAAVLEAAF